MKYFISLGMYDGTVLEIAKKAYPDFDYYIGFEPIPLLYEKSVEKFCGHSNIILYNKAVSISDKKNEMFYVGYSEDAPYYINQGSSLMKTKISGNIDKNNFVLVETIDFSKFIFDNFHIDDLIVLDIDIEGKEYDVLWHLINTGAIKYVNNIYCEWHYKKIGLIKNKHKTLIKHLNKLGFGLTGKIDDFDINFRNLDERYNK